MLTEKHAMPNEHIKVLINFSANILSAKAMQAQTNHQSNTEYITINRTAKTRIHTPKQAQK